MYFALIHVLRVVHRETHKTAQLKNVVHHYLSIITYLPILLCPHLFYFFGFWCSVLAADAVFCGEGNDMNQENMTTFENQNEDSYLMHLQNFHNTCGSFWIFIWKVNKEDCITHYSSHTNPILQPVNHSVYEMFVLKRDGRKEVVHFDKITSRINKLCYGLDPNHGKKMLHLLSRQHLSSNSWILR